MKKVESIIRKSSSFLLDISAWLVLVLVAFICADVIARYVFNNPINFVYELSYILGLFIAALGLAQLMLDGGNVKVDLFSSKFGEKTKLIIEILFAVLIFIPAYTALTYAVGKNCFTAFKTGETSTITTWYPKLWPIKFVLTFGLVMFLIVYIMIVIIKIKELIQLIKNVGGAA